MKIKKYISIYLLLLIFFSCGRTEINNPFDKNDTSRTNVALILCEGLWGYNNTTISKLNLVDLSVQNDFTSITNPNFKIGDTGNDIYIKGDTFFVVVTTSKALEFFDISSGKLIGLLTFEGNSAPRNIAFVNDSICCVTDLYQDCVHIVNLNQKRVVDKVKVGPAPEYILHINDYLIVTNSGYGDYRTNEPKANTISIINTKNWKEERTIPVGPNPIELVHSKKHNLLIVSYNHLPSKKDSIGGILIFNLPSFTKVKEFKTSCRSMLLDETTNSLFFISDSTIKNLNLTSFEIKEVLKNPKPNEIWYSIGIDNSFDYLLVGNAKNYVTEGEVIIYEIKSNPIRLVKKIAVGVNPSKIRIKKN
ncbi:MAG: hypothetical protein N2517_01030 [Ignavibacteria bacterium]|nr:hypothetical protein [Ignavibacteria bacterium]